MSFQEFLEKFKKGQIKIFNFEADFSKLTHLIKNRDVSLKLLNSEKTDNHLHIDNSKHLTINISQLDGSSKEHLKDILHELKDDGFTLLEGNSNKMLENILEEEQTSISKKFLEFFKDKVSLQDLEIIRGALYIRSLFERGDRNLDILKADIRQKYGHRGNNIVNLCSAEYFENYLIPYYEHLEQTEADKQKIIKKFSGVFNMLACELPFTVFVRREMTAEKVKSQIESKFEYGASFVNIHGIGDHNVSTVKEAVEAVRITYGEENILISIDEEKKLIIKARIELRRKLPQGLT